MMTTSEYAVPAPMRFLLSRRVERFLWNVNVALIVLMAAIVLAAAIAKLGASGREPQRPASPTAPGPT